MYYDFKVKIPQVKGKIYERTIKGVVYINYEYDRVYKPDKKYNIPKRTTIGKKCEDDPEMMYPNPNFLTYFPDAKLPEEQSRDARSSCLRIGGWIVIEKLMRESGIDRIISGLYRDDRDSGLFLDLAAYYLITENNAGQYYPDYAYNHPLFTPEYKIYSDSAVSAFLSEISSEDSIFFQNEWNAVKKKQSRDASEKLFKADKSFLENRGPGGYTGESIEGKLLIAFVALILRSRMFTKLKEAEDGLLEKPDCMNVSSAIRELEKIELVRQADGVYRPDRAVTETQKTILKAFGINANYVKWKAREISDELNPKVQKGRKQEVIR